MKFISKNTVNKPLSNSSVLQSICGMLVLSLIGGMLVGCGGDSSDGTSTPKSSQTPTTSYNAVIIGDHPTMFFTMGFASSGTESDFSGSGHVGTYYNNSTGAAWPNSVAMPNGDLGADFNGLGQYLQTSSAPDLSVPTTGVFTFEAWIRPDTLTFPLSEGTGYVHWMGKGSAQQQEYVARMYNLTNTENPPRPNRISGYAFNLVGDLGSGSYFQDTVTVGQWIYVAIVINTINTSTAYPTGYVSIFKNGLARKTTALNQYNVVPGIGGAPLRVGTRDFASFFEGAIGKVAIYNYELSPSQTASHYAAMCGSGC
jgi:hypothetical protein